MNEYEARKEICRVGKSLFERGYVHATAGNISVRLDDGYLITPTDACLGFLEPDALSRIDAQGTHIDGPRPSKTIVLHRRIYEASRPWRPDTRCVIHTHSHACVLLSLLTPARGPVAAPAVGEAELIPPITPYFVMKVGHVPHIAYDRPGAPEVAEHVVKAITAYGHAGSPLRAVMLERLGPNVWHDSPASAMATLEELEETARLWLACRGGTQTVEPLDEAGLRTLDSVFGAHW